MKIRLTREGVIKLYCYTLQGERSIAFALGAAWSEVREYYQGDKIAGLKSVTTWVSELVRCQSNHPPPGRDELGRSLSAPGLVRVLLGKWIGRWKNYWSLPTRVLSFLAAALRSLVQFLDFEARPEQDKLIALRMDLCTSRSLIENCCHGMAELTRARHIEHFWQADWMTPVKLTDILAGQQGRDVLTTKESV